MRIAPATTCAFVTIVPLPSYTMPVPSEPPLPVSTRIETVLGEITRAVSTHESSTTSPPWPTLSAGVPDCALLREASPGAPQNMRPRPVVAPIVKIDERSMPTMTRVAVASHDGDFFIGVI